MLWKGLFVRKNNALLVRFGLDERDEGGAFERVRRSMNSKSLGVTIERGFWFRSEDALSPPFGEKSRATGVLNILAAIIRVRLGKSQPHNVVGASRRKSLAFCWADNVVRRSGQFFEFSGLFRISKPMERADGRHREASLPRDPDGGDGLMTD